MLKYKILFIGLGTMGFHMASYLSKIKKYELYVYNRTKITEKKWLRKYSGKNYNFNKNIKFDFIISCLRDDKAINSVITHIDNSKCFKNSTLFIDHSTISLDQVDKLFKFSKKNNFQFLDAPITGGEEGAKKGKLSVMVGGIPSKFKKAKTIISAYSNNIVLMGKVGSGQLTKFTNQILICGILYSISEAYFFSKKNNLNQNKLYEAIRNGAAGSWQFTNRYKSIHKNKFDFGFSTKLMEKDLRYVLRQAKNKKLNLKLTKNVFNRYKKLQSTKYKDQDTSSLIKSFIN